MGFRSVYITESYAVEVPQWFVDKYPLINYNICNDKKYLSMSQNYESKFYHKLSEDERFLDIQKIVIDSDLDELILILLHECGGITRVKIAKDYITGKEPTEWKDVDEVEHDYCYNCSD